MSSPITNIFESLGAIFDEANPRRAPVHFGDWQAEYRAACETVAIFDCSPKTKIELSGRDRVRFLNNLCTNDIKRLASGAGCEAFFTNAQGKILFFVRVFAAPNSIWIDTVPDVAPSLLAHLDRYRISEQVDWADRSADFAQLLIIGPRALDCLTAAAGTAVPELADFDHSMIVLAGSPCLLIRHTTLVHPAFELRVPAASVAGVWQDVWRAGRSLGMRAMGTSAFEAIRVEAGWPVYGWDIDASNLPQEMGRTARALSFTKGCYLGQETVARIDAMGHVNRHFIGLIVAHDADPPDRGAQVLSRSGSGSGEKIVGQVTSSAYSPSRGHAIALGFVRRGHEQAGTQLVIDCQGKAVGAEACMLPIPART
jgi:folate-binding protein YgfZ